MKTARIDARQRERYHRDYWMKYRRKPDASTNPHETADEFGERLADNIRHWWSKQQKPPEGLTIEQTRGQIRSNLVLGVRRP